MAEAATTALDTAPTRTAARRPSADWRSVFTSVAPYIAILLTWLLCRPFEGVAGDGNIYLGRALADLDPAGIGRDIMFVYDGQSHFSLYRYIAWGLTAAVGPSGTALVMAGINSVAWLISFSYLARQLTNVRLAWLSTLFVSFLPISYGGYHILHAGEIFATPRPLAEACVFLALAFVMQRKFGTAMVGFALATAFHPIMSLAGLAVALMIVVRRIDRLVAVVLVLSMAILGLALMGTPVFHRLLIVIDPAWQALLRTRHPYLYPTLWAPETFARAALSATTLYVASRFSNDVVKRLFVAAAIVGPLGLIASIVFGDILGLLLVEQAQLWRMEWITSTLGAAALALVGLKFWRQGGLHRLSFALLAFAWAFDSESYVALLIAPTALALNVLAARHDVVLRRNSEIALLVIGFVLLVTLKIAESAVSISTSSPDVAHANVLKLHVLSLPLIVLAFVGLQRTRIPKANLILSSAGLMAVIALTLFWDARRPSDLVLDAQTRDPTLTKMIDAYPGEIFWMDGYEPWYLLGRPNWAFQVQGAGGVFSRELSTIFAERVRASIDAGLLPPNAVHPYNSVTTYDLPKMTDTGVRLICARSDAPAWIVMPFPDGAPIPLDVVTHIWHAPYTIYVAHLAEDGLTWHPVSAYVLAACAEQHAMGS